MQLKPTRFAVLLAGFVASYGASAQQEVASADVLAVSQAATGTSDVGRITVEGTDGPGSTGLIAPESTPKARSSVDKAYIEKQSPTSNPYQSLNLLPGVNAGSQDSSGLFGGNLRVRGFNSDQLGFTIDGVPVNDSGNFAVFPQEYTDAENLCNVFVTQGSADTEAPHVGASGGNIGLSSCAPSDKASFTGEYTGGALNLFKGYGKIETGLIGGRWKSYLSYSKSQIDKFKGDGRADRDHIDFQTAFDLGAGSSIRGGFLFNHAINNNIRQLSKTQIAQRGYDYDFSNVAPNHLAPVNGTVQNEGATNNPLGGLPANGDGYVPFNINPFENYIATVNAHFQLAPTFAFDFSPYLWHGFGTGGGQLTTLQEGTSAANVGLLHGGIPDLNGDGDRSDTVLVYRSSVTTTYRPGVTFKFTKNFDNQNIVFGYWAERAHHIQTQPAELITSSDPSQPLRADHVASRFLDDPSAWIRYADGYVYQGRDTQTISTGTSLFISDTITLLNDKLTITPGFRHSTEDRDVRNNPNSGTTNQTTNGTGSVGFTSTGAGYYDVQNAAVKNLPSLAINYAITDTQSVYANGARNFRVPSNFSYFNLVTGGTFVNGVLTNYTVLPETVKAETSNNFDLGYRYSSQKVTFSSALFYNLFKNRIASAFDEQTQRRTDTNVGSSKQYGVELEGGWNFLPHFTLYSSASYLRSEINDNIRNGQTALGVPLYLSTAGKQFPDTPNVLAASNLQYSIKNFYVFVQGKYTGRRQSSLVNDESAPAYALMDIGAGYTFPKYGFLNAVKLQGVVNNVTSEKYLLLNAGSGSNFVNNTQGAGSGTVSYYVGAPVSFAVTLSTEFGK